METQDAARFTGILIEPFPTLLTAAADHLVACHDRGDP